MEDHGSEGPKIYPLDVVARKIDPSPDPEVPEDSEEDCRQAWQKSSGSVTLEQLHEGLVAVYQLADSAINLSLKISEEVMSISKKVDSLEERIDSLQKPVNEVRKNLQGLRDDLREIDEKTKLIPAIKATLLDIYGRLPD